MEIRTILISAFSALVSGLIVATGNHFFNRRQLLLAEREKYRQVVFSEKLKAYKEIAEEIHKFSTAAGKLIPNLRCPPELRGDLSEQMGTVFDLAGAVQLTFNRHIFLIPDKTINRSRISGLLILPPTPLKSFEDLIQVLEQINEKNMELLQYLREDLGINEFAEKLK